MAARHRLPKSSPARCRTTSGRPWSAPARSARAPTRRRTDPAGLTSFSKGRPSGRPFCWAYPGPNRLKAQASFYELPERRNCRRPQPSWYRLPIDSGRSMAEMADDLSTPLGQETVRRKRRYRLPFSITHVVAVLLGLFLVIFVGFAIFNDNPLGGEPVALVAIRQAMPAAEKPAAAASSTSEPNAKSGAKQAA